MQRTQAILAWTRPLDPYANVHVVYRHFSTILVVWKDFLFYLPGTARVRTSHLDWAIPSKPWFNNPQFHSGRVRLLDP